MPAVGQPDTTTIRPHGHRLRELDGLRAWAIAAVFCAHLGLHPFVGGGIGVDLFFVLSGFLITHLLLREYDRRGGIDLLAFYRRRAWRLLPALVLMIVIVDLWTWIDPVPGLLHANLMGSLWVLGFIANWTHEWTGSYIHLWSLGVEEQYYIVWAPLMILLAPRLDRTTGAWILIGLVVFDLGLQAWLYESGAASLDTLHNATYSHAYGLLAGSALAMALTREGRIVKPPWSRWMARFALPSMLILTASLPIVFSPSMAVLFWWPLATIACAALIGGVVVGAGTWTWVLGLAPVVWLGRISYSLYLWHIPVFAAIEFPGYFGGHTPLAAVVKIVLSVALAAASFHLVERPLLRRFAARDSTAVKGTAEPASTLA
jgi:peptidoglycan/LPS O-acetylase OafA/YrhL